MSMFWHPEFADTQRLWFTRAAFLKSELRLYLRLENDQVSTHVIYLKEVAAFYHNLQIETEIRISDWTEHGSFGWWLPLNDPHHSIKISSINPNHGCLLALAKQVEYGFASVDEAHNWPG
ncbi:MAG: hypothetical protein JNK90_21430 [Planctomycetaceae bacterium]|nr:hypothetical protein [Planctomycetaceae bacterium]